MNGLLLKIKTVSTMDVSFLVNTNVIDHLIVPSGSHKVFQDALGRLVTDEEEEEERTEPHVHEAGDVLAAFKKAYLEEGLVGEEREKREEEEEKDDDAGEKEYVAKEQAEEAKEQVITDGGVEEQALRGND